MNYYFVIQSVAKDLGNIHVDVSVDVHEILPPFGRLDDKRWQENKEGGRSPATHYPLNLKKLTLRLHECKEFREKA